MKYIVTKILTSVCLLTLASVSVMAAPDDSEAEYRKLSRSWTLNPDGSQEFRFSMELTLFTHTAMNGTYGESFIVYNPEYQTLNINSSYTVQADGTVVDTPDNAFVEVLPAAAADAPAYNGLKEMVVVHTGLELGATIYLDYTITSKAGYLPELDVYEQVEQSSPVKEYTVSVSVPEEKHFSCRLSGYDTRVAEKSSKGQKTYTWTIKDVKAKSRLSDMYHFDTPYFAANTYSSHNEMAGVLAKQFDDGKSAVLGSLAKKVTGDAGTDTEKLKAIYGYIQDSYAHIPLRLSACGYRIRPAEQVISSAYGTDAELVNVLHGLIAASGLRSDVYAVLARQDTTGLGLKNASLYITAEADGQEYVLGPSVFATREAVIQRQYCPALRLTDGLIEPARPQDAAISYSADMVLERNMLTVKSEATVSDFFLDLEGSTARMITSGDKDASVEAGPASTTFSYSAEIPVEKAGPYMIIHLPDYPFSAIYDPWAAGSKRNIMLTLPAAYDESYTYRINLGKRTLSTPAVDLEIDNSVGHLEIAVRTEGDDAFVTRVLKLSKSQILPDEYADYLELMRAWSDHNYTRVLVK